MDTRTTIVGTGLFALDVLFREDGEVRGAALGGTSGNVLSILAALGWLSVPVGVLGRDAPGRLIKEELSRLGTDLRFLRSSDQKDTPVVFQHQLGNDADGRTHYFSFTCPHCGTKRKPQFNENRELVDEILLAKPHTDVFFLDRPTTAGCLLAEEYADRGALVVFEPSESRCDPDLFIRAARAAHVIKYAQERFEHLDMGSISDRNVLQIQTLGEQGLRFRAKGERGRWRQLNAFKIGRASDTSGAGDWCTAGFIHSMLTTNRTDFVNPEETKVIEALTFGQAIASLNCLTFGARGLLDAMRPQAIVEAGNSLARTRLVDTQDDLPFSPPRLAPIPTNSAGWAPPDRSQPQSYSVFTSCCIA